MRSLTDLQYEILAMDAYNHSYNVQVQANGEQLGNTALGNFAFLADSAILGGGIDVGADFYATAYATSTEIIITYRGADNLVDGILPGVDFNDVDNMVAGLDTEQALLAIEFYSQISATYNSSGSKNIVVNGHSLGGALAGVVATLFHLDGTAFDTTPYEGTAATIHDLGSDSLSPYYDLLDGAGTPSIGGDFDWISVEGELSSDLHLLQFESYTPAFLELSSDDPQAIRSDTRRGSCPSSSTSMTMPPPTMPFGAL